MIDDPSKYTQSFRNAFAGKKAIYHQALLSSFDRLDITKLDNHGNNLAYQLVEAVLKKKPFQVELKTDFNTNQSFHHFYFENRNAGKISGFSPVRLGFPLLITQLHGELVVAPFFLWSIFPEPAATSTESWMLEYRPAYRAQLNPFLHSWLLEVTASDSTKTLSIPSNPGAQELTHFCNEFAQLIGIETSSSYPALSPYPEISEIDSLAEKGAICWSGLIGDFPMAPSVNPELKWKSPEAVLPWGHRLGLLPLDPWQASVARYTQRNQTTLVEGASGTGKTHLLTYLVSNALSNGKTALVVAPSLGALRQIQENLFNLDLGTYSFLLQDEVFDRIVLFELLRGKQKPLKKDIQTTSTVKALEDKLSREQQKLEECYAALRREIFEDENWTQTVGLYLEANRQEGKELLHGQLNPTAFKFQKSELEDITKGIESCRDLFDSINALNHPLQALNAAIFIHNSEEEGLSFIQSQLAAFLEKSTMLQHEYLLLRNEYAERLMDHHGEYYRETKEQLEVVEDKIRDYQNRFETDMLDSGKKTLQFYGLFAEKFRDALAAKEDIAQAYQELIRRFNQNNFFEFSFAAENKRLEQMSVKLDQFGVQLDQWWTGLPDHVQEEMTRLSHKTVVPELDFGDRVRNLELNLDLLVEELNGSGLYQLPLERKMLTIARRQKFLEEIIEKLEETRFHLRDFPTFYNWQHNWFSLSEMARRVVRALTKIKPNDWLTAFQSWYFNQALSKTYDPILPIRELPLDKYVKTHQKLEKLILPATDQYWENKREKGLKSLKRDQKRKYDAIFDKKQQAENFDLENILHTQSQWLVSLLPVILTTPDRAAKYFEGAKPVFDLVLIDEGHQLSPDQGHEVLSKGHRQVIFYDPNLLPNKPESLVSLIQKNGVPPLCLETVHQPGPGNWWQTDIGDAEELNLPDRFSIHYEEVSGRFEIATGTNEEEVQAILRLLNRIEKTPQRTYPSVGIVCFTIEQRNLLSEYLLRIKRQRLTGVEMIQQLERNGLGVYHLAEMGGLHFDILIVSVTYGQTDISGKISQRLAEFNTPEGLIDMQLLLGRATKQLFVMNSLPGDFLEAFSQSKEKKGANLLAHFLLYTYVVSRNKPKQLAVLVREMQRKWGEPKPEIRNPFSKEVIKRLKESGLNGDFQINHAAGNLQLPVVYFPATITEKKPLVFLPDGFFSKASGTDLLWEYQQQHQLQKAGYQIIPIWSVLWWKNANQALYHLLQQLTASKDDEEE
ncbi:MAG: hypothetical protein DHS20C18_40980 [Saprospiraceae bacterium]|nr:MAG: hypothetical protein DHS20C18_40980 [Saprospiraceae bacterium]